MSQAPPATPPDRRFLANPNALRGVAAVVVLLFHVELYSGLVSRHWRTGLLERGYLMVDLFFVLSGFILMHVYGEAVTHGGGRAVRSFLAARFARIYPLHLVTLLYLVVLVIVRYRSEPGAWTDQHAILYDPGDLPHHLFLLQGMGLVPYHSWNDPSWSISTEWWAYVLFPVLVRSLARCGRAALALVATSCVTGYAVIMLVLVPRITAPPAFAGTIDHPWMSIDVTYEYAFLRCLAGFVLGLLTYRGYQAGRARSMGRGPVVLLLVLAVLACMHLGAPDAITVLLFPPLVLAVARGGKGTDLVLECAPLQRLGDWSYAIYLLQIPLMQTMFYLLLIGALPEPVTDTGILLLFSCFVATTILVSAAVHTTVELPLRSALRRSLTPGSSQ